MGERGVDRPILRSTRKSDPKLRTADMIPVLWNKFGLEPFMIRDVMDEFGLKRGEAQRRVNYMVSWGAVWDLGPKDFPKGEKPKGRTPKQYGVSYWGERVAEYKDGEK